MRGQFRFGAKGSKCVRQLVGRCTPLAADAQYSNTRDNVQGVGRHRRGYRQGKTCLCGITSRFHTGRRCALYRPITGKTHGTARQQGAAYLFDARRLGHKAVLVLGPLIHGKYTVSVGGGGDDRHRAACFRQPTGQIVGTAQMAGEQRDCKVAALIQHYNGGVGGLAAAVRRDGSHGNADSPHKNKRVTLCKLRSSPIGKGHAVFAAAGHSTRLGRRKLPGQRQSLAGKGKIRAGHCGAPLRYSVVKVGS